MANLLETLAMKEVWLQISKTPEEALDLITKGH